MKPLIVVFSLIYLVNSYSEQSSNVHSPICNTTECILPDCRCSTLNIPGGLQVEDVPQFVLLTFDDAVTVRNIKYYEDALTGRRNPNGCPISATFFVTHEYTNYAYVHRLHAAGNEIALHSISHLPSTDYWRRASVNTLEMEFMDQRQMMSYFADIPEADMKGIRMPFLQLSGNNQFEMMNNNGLLYDLSWSTYSYRSPGIWPYTLAYKSMQDCPIPPCPTKSYPNVWVIPMNQWENDNGNHTCSMIDTCVNRMERDDNDFEWMKTEFLKHYNGNRSPFGVYTHASWFDANTLRFKAYNKFLDYLETFPDVYVVGASKVIDWVKNPETIDEMVDAPCQEIYKPTCTPSTCRLYNEQHNERWFTSCIPECPEVYPWMDNPFGQ